VHCPDAQRIVVLLGGDSAEREISLKSGEAVLKTLTGSGWVTASLDPAERSVAEFDWCAGDVAFIALHGRFGEDGAVQQILSDQGVPYTGSGPEASRMAFSKSSSKLEFLRQEIPTPPYVTIHHSNSRTRVRRMAEAVRYPLVIKPDQQGSSIGVSIVTTPDQLDAAVAKAFEFGSLAVIEQAVMGPEWTVGFLGGEALPPICVGTPRTFFDYEAKYSDDATTYDFEGALTATQRRRLIQVSRGACFALQVTGISRVDVRFDADGDPWVLEVNTVPGFTDHSLVPKAAEKAGMSFAELCERAIHDAVERNRHRQILPVPSSRPETAPRRIAG
jgi:D-alanine-D-alanine ligase